MRNCVVYASLTVLAIGGAIPRARCRFWTQAERLDRRLQVGLKTLLEGTKDSAAQQRL